MKFGTHFLYRQNPDFARQQCICSTEHRAGFHCTNGLDIGDLPVRVNTRIGPSRTSNIDIVVEKLVKGLSEFALNRAQMRLNLPAVEVRPVIGKSQLEVPHSIGYSMCLGIWAMPAITATIITFNEEDRVAEAIASLSCCDEIIVVDSGSTDRTREIARAAGARVIEHPWEGYSKQKNFAAEQARNDWILSVDADERLSIELADEIVRWKKPLPLGEAARSAGEGSEFGETGTLTGRAFNYWPDLSQAERAFSMPRRVFYLGRWINHSGWYPDPKVRLYDRRFCQWEGDFVHERLKAGGSIGMFHGDLLHFPYRDWNDHIARIARYTDLAAGAARSSGRRGSISRLLLAPPLTFIKSFFLRAGFLDGWRGLAIAYMGARYVFQKEFRILR
jgi:glycosyltransferase involved in cell wall biosynthesis